MTPIRGIAPDSVLSFFRSLLKAPLVSDLLAGGLGAFFGAWAAFKFEARRDENRAEEAKLAAGRFAIFTLAQQINWLASIKSNLELDKWKEDDRTAWHMMPALDPPTKPPPLNIEALSFLLEGETADLLNQLMRCQWSFDNYASALDRRSAFYLKEFQPRMGKILQDMLPNPPRPEEQVRIVGEKLDLHVSRALIEETEALIESFDDTVKIAWQGYRRLRRVIADRYPKERILKMLPPKNLTDEIEAIPNSGDSQAS